MRMHTVTVDFIRLHKYNDSYACVPSIAVERHKILLNFVRRWEDHLLPSTLPFRQYTLLSRPFTNAYHQVKLNL